MIGYIFFRNMHEQKNIPQQVKQAVLALDPEAEVVLFGSQARGDSHEESDWDFLVLLSRKASRAIKQAIRDRLWEIEVVEETLINSLVISKDEWQTKEGWPIHDNVEKEGIKI